MELNTENKTFYIQTFGCQMNEHDSETIAGLLEAEGYSASESREDSDIIVVNTCSVRENADNHFFGQLGVIKKIKEKHPDSIVAVCGCMMQQETIIAVLKQKYPWIDIIFGTMNIHEFPSLLHTYQNDRKHIISIYDRQESIIEGLPSHRKYSHKAFVNIMNGCNNFCTYCIVPYTRGREVSRPPEKITAEINSLVLQGVKEVTLLGQNVNSYGSDNRFDCDFADLIHRINDIDGLERIRFMTSHPKDLSDKLIQTFSECEKLCRHMHLPVQSGSSEILKRMNRHYSKENYLSLVNKIKTAIPDMTFTTDIIVGFPGETEEDFEETIDLVKTVRFDSAFTFLYSIRTGTPAATYDDQIAESVKHQRFQRLVDTINEITAEKNALYDGRVEKVLVDGLNAQGREGIYSGRTGGFKLVNFKASPADVGQIVNVKITEAKTFSLTGEIVKTSL